MMTRAEDFPLHIFADVAGQKICLNCFGQRPGPSEEEDSRDGSGLKFRPFYIHNFDFIESVVYFDLIICGASIGSFL